MEGPAVSITVQVPAALVDERTAERARTLLVLDALRSQRLSWRAAALELGLTPAALLDAARQHGIPTVRYDEAEWNDDLATLNRLTGARPGGE